MIKKSLFFDIARKHGKYASWAVWSEVGEKPKSNIGDMSIFDLNFNPNLLKQLNTNIIMVGLNFSRAIKNEIFVNFHDDRPQAQDYKIRYAFKNTRFYGAYMTDIIKDFEEKISGKVLSYLKNNEEFEIQNIKLFKEELATLKVDNPIIIAFGNDVYRILIKYFKNNYQIIKVPHYSNYISKEKYREKIIAILSTDLFSKKLKL